LKKRCENPVIVFGGGTNGLGIIRNLGRNGVEVYCVVEKADEALYSKYCKKYFIVPQILRDEKTAFSFLSKFRKTLTDYAVIFSTSDSSSLCLSNLKEHFENDYHILQPSPEITRTLINKREFCQTLSKFMIPHPRTYFPNSVQEVKEISKYVTYPVIVKPSFGHLFYRAFNRKGFVANSGKELINSYLAASRSNIDTIIQEFICGSERNLYGIEGYFNKQSIPKAFFAYQRLREWPQLLGINSLLRSVPISDVAPLKEIVEKYLSQLGYYGVFEAEFKWDPKDNNFKILEINARSWLHNTFPTKCGINIILFSYLEAIGEEVNYVEDYKVGVKSMNFKFDLQASMKKNGLVGAIDCFSSLLTTKDKATFSTDDILPWAVSSYFDCFGLGKNFRAYIKNKSK
jgi:predicted ATP-grasp superfamily ATP-dependent carboligase